MNRASRGHPLTSRRLERRPGDTDTCAASWTSQCDVSMVKGHAVTDYPIATKTGDVYFYSPEILDGAENGVDGARNLYVYRDGRSNWSHL